MTWKFHGEGPGRWSGPFVFAGQVVTLFDARAWAMG